MSDLSGDRAAARRSSRLSPPDRAAAAHRSNSRVRSMRSRLDRRLALLSGGRPLVVRTDAPPGKDQKVPALRAAPRHLGSNQRIDRTHSARP
jgi:hypothetical protein